MVALSVSSGFRANQEAIRVDVDACHPQTAETQRSECGRPARTALIEIGYYTNKQTADRIGVRDRPSTL
jgi:hypothetical protein